MTYRPGPARSLLVMLLALGVAVLGACGDDEAAVETAPETDGVSVVASTSWAGAFARLAGAQDVTVIAPADLQHPPDYDPRPSDLVAVAEADYVVYAGFESFADRLVEAAGSGAEMVEVNLDNGVDNIEGEVRRLAELFGTEDEAEGNLDALTTRIGELADEVRAAVPDPAPVLVSHLYMQAWVDFAGLTPAGTFGPAPPTAAELVALGELKPALVIDNAHGPVGAALADTGAVVVAMRQFPDADMDLVPVFEQNAAALLDALGG